MKKAILRLLVLTVFISCNNATMDAPDETIKKMVVKVEKIVPDSIKHQVALNK